MTIWRPQEAPQGVTLSRWTVVEAVPTHTTALEDVYEYS